MRKYLSVTSAVAVTIALFFSSTVRAEEIDKLAWMAGIWTQVKDGETVQETWLGPRGKMRSEERRVGKECCR